VFDGNRVDVTTVEEIVGTMEKRLGVALFRRLNGRERDGRRDQLLGPT
jgi:hypothetical protein